MKTNRLGFHLRNIPQTTWMFSNRIKSLEIISVFTISSKIYPHITWWHKLGKSQIYLLVKKWNALRICFVHLATYTVSVSMTVNGDTFDILLTNPFGCIGSMKLTLNWLLRFRLVYVTIFLYNFFFSSVFFSFHPYFQPHVNIIDCSLTTK